MKVAAGPLRVAAAIAATLAIAALPVIVLAHAELVSSDPPAGGTLTTTPYTLTATFDDELTADGSSIVIEDASGAQVTAGTVSPGDAQVMTVELPGLSNGEYTVRWTAVSADDGAVERGTYTFSVGIDKPAMPTPNPTPPPDDGYRDFSEDPIVAVGLAAIGIILLVGFIFLRRRR